MTGAGFGGCVVALVYQEKGTAFVKTVVEGYTRMSWKVPQVHICRASGGVETIYVGE